jgi:DnaJ-domain-containing protein 1
MSIGRRLFNLAKSELNSLLDRAAEAEHVESRDPDEDLYRRFSLDEISDQELEAELERRHRARQAQARGASTTSRPADEADSARASSGAQASKPAPDDELRRAYAALEVPFGADFATVRKSYRALMRKYHPDRHTESPEKQKTATELAQKLSQAFQVIEHVQGQSQRHDATTRR